MTVNGAFSFSHVSLRITSPIIIFLSFYQEVNIDYRLLLYDNLIQCFVQIRLDIIIIRRIAFGTRFLNH